MVSINRAISSNLKNSQQILSIEQAKALILQSQGLLNPNFGKGKTAVKNAVEHIGYVQIDTLSVAARAHHHTLWSRLYYYK